MEHPFEAVTRPIEAINRFCKQKNVDPVYLLANLLSILALKHRGAVLPTEKRERKETVFDEISATLHFAERKDDPPPSVIGWMDLLLQFEQASNEQKMKLYRDNKRDDIADRFQPLINAEETFRLIIRDLINKAEMQGLEQAIWLDETLKRQADEEDDSGTS